MFVNSIIEFNIALVLDSYKTFLKTFLCILDKLAIYQQNFLFKYFSCEKNWSDSQLNSIINYIKQKEKDCDIFRRVTMERIGSGCIKS